MVVDLTGDENPTDEDVDIGLGDLTGVLAPSGDEISLGGKKSQESDIDGGGNNSMSNRYLVKSSEELGEMFPGEAGKFPRRKITCQGLHFLNFFNDPRIIREQRIAAYKGYRGGSGGCFEMKGYGARWKLMKVVLGVVVAAAVVVGREEMWLHLRPREGPSCLGVFCTQRKVSMVSFGRISLNRFLSSILLVVVIIIMVVIVVVILVVVIFEIVEVVIVVVVVRLACSIPIGWAYAFHQDKASSVKVPVANVTLFSLAHLLRENTDSVRSNQRIRPTAPSVPLKQKELTS
ncbi:hypothetical protein Tco_0003655 [Tanacetum coccineum]